MSAHVGRLARPPTISDPEPRSMKFMDRDSPRGLLVGLGNAQSDVSDSSIRQMDEVGCGDIAMIVILASLFS
jgi:hypothetical protein